jgi:serine/threonine protein kinase/tetratricopeptide (TPR) repeat protein
MTPERWHQIEEIFHEALDLEAGPRAKFIKQKAGDDGELKAEVERLLSQFDEASSFIEQPLYDSAKNAVLSSLLDETDEDPMVGTVLGNYRIEREVGRGGMGAVYEAYRADGEFRLRVALKVVKRGVDTDFVLRRFRNERQILAAFDHPFITRLIDGGSTPDGRPYFVMEFIDGQTLYRYCDKNRLSIDQRLELFCRICEPVEYAHQKLIIHRDLKPSNIFITNDGTPRLLDFGIAKLLDPDMASDTLEPTATALRMMTVDYASPEQVRGDRVTYSTDVYSLGVILFELLTGYRPYRLQSRSPHDVARAICDDEPILPSVAASGRENEVSVVRVNPSAPTLTGSLDPDLGTPEQLAAQLLGNLDNIILKALSKTPDERYSSVADFRQDIECHLKGETVAIPIEFPRLTKRRAADRDDSTLLAVLPLSVLNGPSGESTDEAYLTVGLADAIITRLTSVRKLTVRPTSSITRYHEHHINPFRAGMELGVDYVLDGRLRRFGERLRISLQLLDVKNFTAIWAGQFDELLTDVLELEDAISEQVAAALIPHLTGEDRQKLAKRGTNDPKAYEAYLRGRFYWNQFTVESFGKAIESFKEAAAIDPDYALAHVGIADFYIWANIYGLVPANEYYENADAALERALSIDDQLGEAYASLALVTNNRFRPVESERLMLRALDLVPHYPHAYEWYSALLVSSGRNEEGIRSVRKAEDLDPLSLRTKTLVAWTIYQTGDLQTALSKAEEIISLDDTYPQGHLQRGNILIELGRADEAVVEIERAMELMPGSALAQYYLCFALTAAGRNDEAVKLADEMETAATDGYVKPMFLGLSRVATGEFDKAFPYLNTAVDEFDPWLVWLETEPKLEPIRSNSRYAKLVARTKIDEGHIATERWPGRITGGTGALHEAPTIPGPDVPTDRLPRGFARRHRVKLAVTAIFAAIIAVGYFSGAIEFSISRGDQRISRQSPVTKRAIALLPFENATGDASNDFISDGMSDGLITRLVSYPEIRNVTRASASIYRSKQMDPRAIGRELGVDSVLTGTLTIKGDEFTLNTKLINVDDGKQLYSMFFSDKADKILELQDQLISLTIEKLELKADDRAAAKPKSYTENNEAFSLFLKGEYSRQKGTPAGTTESIKFYKQAIELDPNYALAYQGLALAYRIAPAYGTHTPQEAYPAAKDSAMKALAIDPTLGSAHVPLASIKFVWDWDFAGAESEYKEAIKLSPNNAEAHYSYGNALVALGRSDEALTELRIAQQLDPLSNTIASNTAWAFYIAGRLDEAETQIRQVLARDPNFARAHLVLGEIYLERGKYDLATSSFQNSKQLAGDPLTDMAIGHAYGVAGRSEEAKKIAAELEAKVMKKEVSAFLPAVVYAGLNEKDKSFYWLERAYQERSNWLTLLKVGRRMKNLHGDPRFDDLLKRIGF